MQRHARGCQRRRFFAGRGDHVHPPRPGGLSRAHEVHQRVDVRRQGALFAVDARVEAREGLAAADAAGPGPQVVVFDHVGQRRGGRQSGPVEVGLEQSGRFDVAHLALAPREARSGVQRQPLERADVGVHVETAVHHLDHALAHLLAQVRRRGQVQHLGRHVVGVQVTGHQGVAQALFHQHVGDARGPVETHHRQAVRHGVDGHVGQRVQARAQQQDVRGLVGGFDAGRLADDLHHLVQARATQLVGQVDRIRHVALGVVAAADPDEAAVPAPLRRHHMAGALDEQVHALALLHEAGAQDHERVVGLAARTQCGQQARVFATPRVLVACGHGQVAAALRQHRKGLVGQVGEFDVRALARQRRGEYGFVGPVQRAAELRAGPRIGREFMHQADGRDAVARQRLQHHARLDAVDHRELRTMQRHQLVDDHRRAHRRAPQVHRAGQPGAAASEVVGQGPVAQQHRNHVVAFGERRDEVEAEHRRAGTGGLMGQHQHRLARRIERDAAFGQQEARARTVPAFGLAVRTVVVVGIHARTGDVRVLQQVELGIEGVIGRRRCPGLVRRGTVGARTAQLQPLAPSGLARRGRRQGDGGGERRAGQAPFLLAVGNVVRVGIELAGRHVRVLGQVPLGVELHFVGHDFGGRFTAEQRHQASQGPREPPGAGPDHHQQFFALLAHGLAQGFQLDVALGQQAVAVEDLFLHRAGPLRARRGRFHHESLDADVLQRRHPDRRQPCEALVAQHAQGPRRHLGKHEGPHFLQRARRTGRRAPIARQVAVAAHACRQHGRDAVVDRHGFVLRRAVPGRGHRRGIRGHQQAHGARHRGGGAGLRIRVDPGGVGVLAAVHCDACSRDAA